MGLQRGSGPQLEKGSSQQGNLQLIVRHEHMRWGPRKSKEAFLHRIQHSHRKPDRLRRHTSPMQRGDGRRGNEAWPAPRSLGVRNIGSVQTERGSCRLGTACRTQVARRGGAELAGGGGGAPRLAGFAPVSIVMNDVISYHITSHHGRRAMRHNAISVSVHGSGRALGRRKGGAGRIRPFAAGESMECGAADLSRARARERGWRHNADSGCEEEASRFGWSSAEAGRRGASSASAAGAGAGARHGRAPSHGGPTHGSAAPPSTASRCRSDSTAVFALAGCG